MNFTQDANVFPKIAGFLMNCPFLLRTIRQYVSSYPSRSSSRPHGSQCLWLFWFCEETLRILKFSLNNNLGYFIRTKAQRVCFAYRWIFHFLEVFKCTKLVCVVCRNANEVRRVILCSAERKSAFCSRPQTSCCGNGAAPSCTYNCDYNCDL